MCDASDHLVQMVTESTVARLAPVFPAGSDDLVRKKRLELSRVAPLAPKASASTNSATFAVTMCRPANVAGHSADTAGFDGARRST